MIDQADITEKAAEGLPVPGDGLLVLLLAATGPTIHRGWLRFDRGRGLIVDLEDRGGWKRGNRVLLAHAGPNGLHSRGAVVSEVVSPTRGYLLPSGPWKPTDRREHIRAVVEVPCGLYVPPDVPDRALSRTHAVELSASGFRWFDTAPVEVGDPVTLSLVLGRGAGRRIDLVARVVRVRSNAGEGEVAGTFTAATFEDVDAILDAVYRQRLKELGVERVGPDAEPLV